MSSWINSRGTGRSSSTSNTSTSLLLTDLQGVLLDSLAEGVVVQDEHDKVLACNEAAPSILGLTRNQLLGLDSMDPRWRAINRDGTPTNFEILASAPAQWHPDDCEWYERWEPGRKGNAVLGVYTRGGTVFTCGSTDWSHGLRGRDPAVERITRNILDRLGK